MLPSGSSPLLTFSTTYHTRMTLSSDTEQSTRGSLDLQVKSGISAVWPPWRNNFSVPSSASSRDCSSPIVLKSHTFRLRSVPLKAEIVSLRGNHWTWNISSLCDSKECYLTFIFLGSRKATVSSADPVAKKGSSLQQCEHQLSGLVWKYCLHDVPDHKFLIISNWPKQKLMEHMPGEHYLLLLYAL